MVLLERRVDLDDVREKYRRKNQLLFSRESACRQDLIRLICLQKHRTIVLWALRCAEIPVALLKCAYPDDTRPEEAVQVCRMWAEGCVKMPEARKAILQVHAMAREVETSRAMA